MPLPPLERRRIRRRRVIFGGTILHNQGRSRVDCVVQNYSEDGAKLALDHLALLPDHIDLIIDRKGGQRRAKIVWRGECEAGVTFLPALPPGAAISIDWARRLRDCEAERKALKARVEQLIANRE